MHIKKLTSSNALKRGELVIVLKGWRGCEDALTYLKKNTRTGAVQFYRHREEPVPWVGRWSNYRFLRHPRTTNERRAYCATGTTREIVENHGAAFKVRRKRSLRRLPTTYADIFLPHPRNWKEYRRTQRKAAGSINRRIHSPPFWAHVVA